MDCPTKWGLSWDFDEPRCTRCGCLDQKKKMVLDKEETPSSIDTPLGDRTRETPVGRPQSKRRVTQLKMKGMLCWSCDRVLYFAANCLGRRCWFCNEPDNLKRNCPYRSRRNETQNTTRKKTVREHCDNDSKGCCCRHPYLGGWRVVTPEGGRLRYSTC